MIAGDGVRRFWNPDDPDAVRVPAQTDARADLWPAFRRLDDIPREIVLDDLLFRMVSVVPGFDGASRTGSLVLRAGMHDLVTLHRPGDNGAFVKQLDVVIAAADLRADRLIEIEEQVDDILGYFAAILHLQEDRTPWTMELLTAAIRLAGYVVMPIKLYFDVPRPIHYARQVLPVIQTPFHGAWPSGHAIEAFAVATVIEALTAPTLTGDVFDLHDSGASMGLPMRMAERIADNRMIAGVHFPTDSLAGAVLGVALGQALVNRALGRPRTPAYTLAAGAGMADDFNLGLLAEHLDNSAMIDLEKGTGDPILPGLWREARAEMVR